MKRCKNEYEFYFQFDNQETDFPCFNCYVYKHGKLLDILINQYIRQTHDFIVLNSNYGMSETDINTICIMVANEINKQHYGELCQIIPSDIALTFDL